MPLTSKPWIVCAAIRRNFHIITGARHWDSIMHNQADAYNAISDAPSKMWEQGFIDQWGKFYNRKEAMKIVKQSGQPFDEKRNSGNGEDLYSEGLY